MYFVAASKILEFLERTVMEIIARLLVLLAARLVLETEQLGLRKRRVVDGNDAFQAQFPYIARLQKLDGELKCSAVIIDIQWILTAGHCLKNDEPEDEDEDEFVVAVDTFHQNSGTTYRVSQTYVHPEYKPIPAHTYNDIALIRLAEPLTLSGTVQPIPLGLPPEDEEDVIEAGWGQINAYVPILSPFLQSISLKVMPTKKCQEIHDSANNIVNGTTQICVYSDVKGSSCFGDSGGPLVSVATGRLLGVFSGLEDCAGKYPTLFAKVPTFVDWIESVTGRKFPLK